MWIKLFAFACCIAYMVQADDHRQKKKDEARGKRNLEYSISHTYPNNFRSERRISTFPQLNRYPPYFSGPRPYPYKKGRPQSIPAPPYAVQMEPLVQYSQRDPLYDSKLLVLADGRNELKSNDLLSENNHLSETIYGPSVKHVVERPVYIKEPEPIIEIIIKESNVTLPAPPLVVTPSPKKKEEVQVFYVKYKKNPHGTGKNAVIYDKPIPAISPLKHEEKTEDEPRQSAYIAPELVTSAPPPSTTLRAIIKPDSETYHSNVGVHVTFGGESEVHDKASNDDADEESAPQPAIALPQNRQFNQAPPLGLQPLHLQKRLPPVSVNNPPINFRPDGHRIPEPYRPFGQPSPSSQFKQAPAQFGRNFGPPNHPSSQPQLPNRPPENFNGPPVQNGPSFFQRPSPPQFNHPPLHHTQFNQPPRLPVPYKPFDQQNTPAPLVQFPRTQSHFPIHQQPPLVQQSNVFNQQLAPRQQQYHIQHNTNQPQNNNNQPRFSPINPPQNLPPQNHASQQQRFPQPPAQTSQHQPSFSQQQNFFQQPPHLNQQQQFQQTPRAQFNNQNYQHQQFSPQLQNPQHSQRIIPPGGELIAAVPKFEQHISVPNQQQQPHTYSAQQAQNQNTQQHQSIPPHIQPQSQQPVQTQIQQSIQPQIQQSLQPQIPNQFHQQPQVLQTQHNGNSNNQIQQHQHQQVRQDFNQKLQSQEQFYNQNQFSQNFNQQLQSDFANAPTIYHTTSRPVYSTTPQITTTTTPTTTTTTEKNPDDSKKNEKPLNVELPDEVPDDLREQLLSSGILANAQISVLDYDKVGDIPLSALPPDQLANFYSAGGAQQIAAANSEPIPAIVDQSGAPVEADQDTEASEIDEVKVKEPVEMKVVHYDPQTQQGQQVQESYVQDDAAQVDPVILNDQKYTRYLPLKVSGAQFPIPDVPELKGKTINSVVVLAPVDYNFQDNVRTTRDAKELEEVKFLNQGQTLRDVLENPTAENYKKWLDTENKTASDKQSVILLVTGSEKDGDNEKEIFMYDVATQTVSKLSGELSAAFVEAAESNTNEKPNAEPALSASASNLVETRVPSPEGFTDRQDLKSSDGDLDESASDFIESKVPIIDPMETDLDAEGSEQLESFVDVSGLKVLPHEDLTAAASDINSVEQQVFISEGYSKTGRSNLPL